MNLPLTKKLRRQSKRLPEFLSLLLFMLLCACTAYWVMQLIKPQPRAVAAPPQAEQAQIDVSLAAGLFGGRGAVTVASNYQLSGVVAAKEEGDSVAILSADGKPAQAVRQGKELLPGTSIKEVHATYVLLSEGGVLKRVMLPEDVRSKSGMVSPAPISAPVQTAPSQMAPALPNQDLPPEQPAVPVQDK